MDCQSVQYWEQKYNTVLFSSNQIAYILYVIDNLCYWKISRMSATDDDDGDNNDDNNEDELFCGDVLYWKILFSSWEQYQEVWHYAK